MWWEQVLHEIYPSVKIQISEAAGSGCSTHGISRGDIIITHPEALLTESHARMLQNLRWDIVILDEAHRFKNRKAKRTKQMVKIPTRLKWALTATPYGRNPADMWQLLNWLDPSNTDFTSYWTFFNTFVDAYRPPNQNFSIVRGGKNLDILAQRIAPYFIRRTLVDVKIQLPPVTAVNVPVLLGPRQSEVYNDLKNHSFHSWGPKLGQDITAHNALSLITRLQQIAVDPSLCIPWQGATAKQEWLEEWLEDHPNEDVIVTSRFRGVTEWNTFAGWPRIVGGMKDSDVADEVAQFNETGRLVGTIDALKETFNFQRANNIIILDGLWSPDTMYQLRKRIERIGQGRPCYIQQLIGMLNNRRSTIDALIERTVTQRLTEAQMLAEFVEGVNDDND
jgi:SNF2 family DNA or RNA helicase